MSDDSSVSLSAPLALRELLDYIAPGGCFLLSILLFDACLHRGAEIAKVGAINLHTPLYGALRFLYARASGAESWPAAALIASVLLGTAYIAGHVVASVSALVIERTFVFKGYGYPYENLLEIRTSAQNAADGARRFYHSVFFWGNGAILAVLANLILPLLSAPTWIHLASSGALYLALCVFAALLILKTFALLLTFLDTTRLSVASKNLRQFASLQAFYYRVIRYSSGPYELAAGGLSRILNTRSAFDSAFLDRYRNYFRHWFREDYRLAGTNNFWLSYCFVNSRSEVLASMLHNFRMQYSFARNIAAAFYLSSLYALSWFLLFPNLHQQLWSDYQLSTVLFSLIWFAAGSLMLVRYYYLFVCYYSKFVFRAFVAINDITVPVAAPLQVEREFK